MKLRKKLNYTKDQAGIINRYIREKNNWDFHLFKTKEFILKCLENKIKEKVAILGSGWLLDIPIFELLKKFSQVFLFDIIHPGKIKNQLKDYKNVIFVETDLTDGFAEQVYFIIKNKIKKGINDFAPNNMLDFTEFDFVISSNILNQLDIILKDNLKRLNLYNDLELVQFSKKIQEHHLKLLPLKKTCLITDYEEMLFNKNNKFVKTNKLIFTDLPESKTNDEWEWIFDTKMTYYNEYITKFNVKAIEF
ncbi:MAG: hypothetical protein JXB17_03065 [Bacteroidales bacterium]|nr:hypothetical protein [Bacteroidales bacterium]